MARNIKINEEQAAFMKKCIKEDTGIDVTSDKAPGQSDQQAITNTRNKLKQAGIQAKVDNIEVPANESYMITGRQLEEARLKALKKGSRVFKAADFMK